MVLGANSLNTSAVCSGSCQAFIDEWLRGTSVYLIKSIPLDWLSRILVSGWGTETSSSNWHSNFGGYMTHPVNCPPVALHHPAMVSVSSIRFRSDACSYSVVTRGINISQCSARLLINPRNASEGSCGPSMTNGTSNMTRQEIYVILADHCEITQ